jgi:septal ring factor EnvC (AmiA/AmiB activator)
MKIVELKREIDTQFAEVAVRFRDVDRRFDDVNARFDEVNTRFEEVNTRFEEVNTRFDEVNGRFTAVDARLDQLESRLTADHETTRRYMDVLIEQLRAEYRLGLDKVTAMEQRWAKIAASNASDHAVFTAVLQQHEIRITALEAKDNSSEPPSSI